MDEDRYEPRFWARALRVSRRDRECRMCGHLIRKGEQYRRVFVAPDIPGDGYVTWDEHVNSWCSEWPDDDSETGKEARK